MRYRLIAAAGCAMVASLVMVLATTGVVTHEMLPTTGSHEADQADGADGILLHSTFDDGHESWWGGETSLTAADGELVVDVPGGTAEYWDEGIGSDRFSLEAGQEYTLSFEASASDEVTIRPVVQAAHDPYTEAFVTELELGTEPREFVYTFTSPLAEEASHVSFQLGSNDSWQFHLDNVRLQTGAGGGVTEDPAPEQPPEAPPEDPSEEAGSDEGDAVEPDPGDEPDTDPPARGDGAFYADPDNNAYAWAEANAGDPRAETIVDGIASHAGARWFGDWDEDISAAVSSYVGAAATEGSVPILAAYNIPNRDCGLYSSGGAAGEADYEAWISSFAEAIGDNEAVVILEPDALAQMLTCNMDEAAVASRTRSLSHATAEFAAKAPDAKVYIDAGNSGWIDPGEMAGALEQVGVQDVRGFAVNVSNYKSTADSAAYGNAVNAALPAPQQFVIDTSRNGGTVAESTWCNPRGAKLGETSRWLPDDAAVDAHLWIKVPGDSDGECTAERAGAADPAAGAFSPDFAVALITGDWAAVPN